MNMSVIGTGYMGVVVGGSLAEIGNQIVGADADTTMIRGRARSGGDECGEAMAWPSLPI